MAVPFKENNVAYKLGLERNLVLTTDSNNYCSQSEVLNAEIIESSESS